MTKGEYLSQKKAFELTLKENLKKLAINYALANSPVKRGDFVTGHAVTIKVDDIKVAWGFREECPECIYRGPAYTKKLVPFKKPKRESVYQSNVKKHISITEESNGKDR